MLKNYVKPEVTRIEMRPTEALFINCKLSNDLQYAHCLSSWNPGYGCVRADGYCLQEEGS